MPDEAPDDDLMRRSAAGERDAFAQLVARHQAAVFRFARTLTSDPALAEDVLQETFLAALRGAHTYRGPDAVAPWLRTIARHALHHQLRRTTPEPVDDEALEQLGAAAGWGSDDLDVLRTRARSHARVDAALAALSPEDREVIVLRDLDGVPGEVVASELGLSLAAMKSRLHRARLRLAAALRRAP
jgi:RNA polymerase sigma-70 factor (ECF subfamily)